VTLLLPTAEEGFASPSRVVNCEWKAANRYDNGSYTVSQLAERVTGVCSVERIKHHQLYHLSIDDPEVELNDFKQATALVEEARKERGGNRER
jgi:hypothetical protein